MKESLGTEREIWKLNLKQDGERSLSNNIEGNDSRTQVLSEIRGPHKGDIRTGCGWSVISVVVRRGELVRNRTNSRAGQEKRILPSVCNLGEGNEKTRLSQGGEILKIYMDNFERVADGGVMTLNFRRNQHGGREHAAIWGEWQLNLRR